ncbi:MAG: LamB/YcsF family protein [Candidatus Bathycorpusculaceae bacterium]
MKQKIDINCDLGESYGAFKVGEDENIMPHITSANIACGFHGGDPVTIAKTVNLAKKYDVAVGAHPGYPDLIGFGRRSMQLSTEEARNYVIYQMGALEGFTRTAKLSLQHVKLHGAFYNMAVMDEKLSKAVAEAVKAFDKNLIVFALPNSVLAKIAQSNGLRVANEFFADRAYNTDRSLVSRKQSNAIISEPEKVVERVIRAVAEGTVLAINNDVVSLGEIHTVCVHGDTPEAVKLVKAIRKGLEQAEIEVKPVGTFI